MRVFWRVSDREGVKAMVRTTATLRSTLARILGPVARAYERFCHRAAVQRMKVGFLQANFR